ncbi:MAG: LolA family protein [Acidobacteriaceae bacterium]
MKMSRNPGRRCAFLVGICTVGMVALVLAAPAGAVSGRPAGPLGQVLEQMDAAAKNFHSAQAEFQWDQYERVVENTDTQKGAIYFLRSGNTTEMAARVKQFNGQPDAKDVVYKDGVLQFYQPKIEQMTIFHAGRNQQQFESFLTLGFGGSGSDLEKNWEITYQGAETIDGVKTAKLDLVGKQASVRNMFTHVTIWVDPTRAISLKQQFFEPSGDVRTAFYRNIRYNQKVAVSVFRIKTTSKTTVVQK